MGGENMQNPLLKAVARIFEVVYDELIIIAYVTKNRAFETVMEIAFIMFS